MNQVVYSRLIIILSSCTRTGRRALACHLPVKVGQALSDVGANSPANPLRTSDTLSPTFARHYFRFPSHQSAASALVKEAKADLALPFNRFGKQFTLSLRTRQIMKCKVRERTSDCFLASIPCNCFYKKELNEENGIDFAMQ